MTLWDNAVNNFLHKWSDANQDIEPDKLAVITGFHFAYWKPAVNLSFLALDGMRAVFYDNPGYAYYSY